MEVGRVCGGGLFFDGDRVSGEKDIRRGRSDMVIRSFYAAGVGVSLGLNEAGTVCWFVSTNVWLYSKLLCLHAIWTKSSHVPCQSGSDPSHHIMQLPTRLQFHPLSFVLHKSHISKS